MILINIIFIQMLKDLSLQEKNKFSTIIFQNQNANDHEIDQLEEVQVERLKSVYAQKINYDIANRHIQPPPQYMHDSSLDPPEHTCCSSVCCCFYPQNYRDTCSITSDLFKKRIIGTLTFWKNDFLSDSEEKDELYGPFWMTLTYIIILGLAANLNQHLANSDNAHFRTQNMMKAFLVAAIVHLIQIFIYGAIVRCWDGELTNKQSAMLIGYSLILYYVTTFLCFLPSSVWHIIMLIIGSILRGIFLARNYSSRMPEKIFILIIAVAVLQVINVILLNSMIFSVVGGSSISDGAKKVFHMQIRHFSSDTL